MDVPVLRGASDILSEGVKPLLGCGFCYDCLLEGGCMSRDGWVGISNAYQDVHCYVITWEVLLLPFGSYLHMCCFLIDTKLNKIILSCRRWSGHCNWMSA